MRKWNITHPQDLTDAFSQLKEERIPFIILKQSTRPKTGKEVDSWKRLNSLFHRGVVPTYSNLSGLGEDEAKQHLQQLFALYREHEDHYEVESVAGMSIERLNKFIDDCQGFLIQNYGARADEMLIANVKTKKIPK